MIRILVGAALDRPIALGDRVRLIKDGRCGTTFSWWWPEHYDCPPLGVIMDDDPHGRRLYAPEECEPE